MPREKPNLVGSRVGRWTVIKLLWTDTYECKCDCGTSRTIKYKVLRYKQSGSCGCIKAESNRAKLLALNGNRLDLTGSSNGMLSYLNDLPDDEKAVRWILCQCACGNTKKFRAADYIRGLTKSCGCYLKQHGSMLGTAHKGNLT